jgi:hypothetical protein
MRLPATLVFRRSPALIVVLALAHLLVGVGLLATDLSGVGKLLAWPILAWSLLASVRRMSAGALTLGRDGRLALVCAEGEAVDCLVDASTAVLPWLIVLRLRTPAGRKSLTLPVDAMDAEGHRRLRVWLKWKATGEKA